MTLKILDSFILRLVVISSAAASPLVSELGAYAAVTGQLTPESERSQTESTGAAPSHSVSNHHWSVPFAGRLRPNASPEDEVIIQAKPANWHAVSKKLSATLPQSSGPALTLTPAIASRRKSAEFENVDTSRKNNPSDVSTYNQIPLVPQSARSDNQVVNLTPANHNLLAVAPTHSGKVISGGISTWDGPIDVDKVIDSLVDTSYANSAEGKRLDTQLRRLSTASQKAIGMTKDCLQNSIQYQGFEPSKRAGRLILDQKCKMRNKSWAEYERQKYIDKLHVQIVSSMMQISEAVGMSDPSRRAEVFSAAQNSLANLVGKDEAVRTTQGMKSWLARLPNCESSFKQAPWSTIERNKKAEDALTAALKQDPVVAEVTKKLHKYANPGTIKSGASRVIETSCNLVTIFGPGLAIPLGSELVNNSFIQATGGTEQAKLEKEILLDKRIQSRLRTLNHETNLALDNYRFAQVTHNSSLLNFCQQFINCMTGTSNLQKIVGAQIETLQSGTAALPANKDLGKN